MLLFRMLRCKWTHYRVGSNHGAAGDPIHEEDANKTTSRVAY